ncbi:MAG: phytoene/squalene synthase family protein [Anaerolineae bacterium]|nr:phytoene/squalene synthase family protein [Anaerolineae bacterium]
MTVYAWENGLLASAHEALESHIPLELIQANDRDLLAAYAYCDVVTRYHSRTFYIASGLLPRAKRQAARALYAFCRVTDNLVDDNPDDSSASIALEHWRQMIDAPRPATNNPVALAWADARARYGIPRGYADQLIDGVAQDLTKKRYESFDELAEYAYGVASTVGLMAMYIIGFEGAEALPYAVKLGVALQMTNILRDIEEDWDNGRLYLPADELALFGLGEADIANKVVDERWRAFMNFQIERTRRLYDESWPGIQMLNADGRFAIAAAADLYRAILTDIEKHDGNVFHRRARISTTGKLVRLPRIWWRSRTA